MRLAVGRWSQMGNRCDGGKAGGQDRDGGQGRDKAWFLNHLSRTGASAPDFSENHSEVLSTHTVHGEATKECSLSSLTTERWPDNQ